jgi:2-aminoadipate transaminase
METSPLSYSRRKEWLQASPIREILAVSERPGMISFAGGLPAADSFPETSLAAMPRQCLQYGASEGDPALRRQVADELAALGLPCYSDQVLILSGSQQGIDLAAKLFIDPGTTVAVQSPTYLAALQVFRFFGARFISMQGAEWPATEPRPGFVYANPTFANPTGHCMDAAERQSLARICDDSGVVLFEDDPYRDLAYDACERKPVCALLERSAWIYLGSFSKSLAPGLRLGFLAASPDLMPWLTRLKQAADLHSNRVSQWLVLQMLRDPNREQRMASVVAAYRQKRDAFAAALACKFGDVATWRSPPGGLFFWLELRQRIDTLELLAESLQRGVAFMPGEPFFADDIGPRGALRLNFSHADAGAAERGLRILADVLRSRL